MDAILNEFDRGKGRDGSVRFTRVTISRQEFDTTGAPLTRVLGRWGANDEARRGDTSPNVPDETVPKPTPSATCQRRLGFGTVRRPRFGISRWRREVSFPAATESKISDGAQNHTPKRPAQAL